MTLRLIRHLCILCGALCLLAAPVAHAAPPKGDMLAAPVQIAVNSSKTVKKVHNATEEAGTDDASVCDGGGAPKDSVWFAFTLSWGGTIDLYRDGSILVADAYSAFPYMALFSYSAGSGLSEIECTQTGNLYGVLLDAGEYRVLMAHTVGFVTMGPGSRYRLGIRAQTMGLAQNHDFDAPIEGVWKIKKAGDPPMVFQQFPTIDDGEIRFDGAAKGQISQKIAIPPNSQFKFVPGDFLRAAVFINATPVAGSNVKIRLSVTYWDGTPPSKAILNSHVTETSTTDYETRYAVLDVRSTAVSSILVSVSSPTAADTFTLEVLPLAIYRGSMRAALPLPPSP